MKIVYMVNGREYTKEGLKDFFLELSSKNGKIFNDTEFDNFIKDNLDFTFLDTKVTVIKFEQDIKELKNEDVVESKKEKIEDIKSPIFTLNQKPKHNAIETKDVPKFSLKLEPRNNLNQLKIENTQVKSQGMKL